MPIAFSPWAQTLQPASYNGIPFIVQGDVYSTGRRVAIHEYPYRDTPLCEDLGLARRNVQFQAFLVGDDCYDQRDQLQQACETGGNGVLVHPSIGSLTVALVAASFAEQAEKGRTVQCSLTFVVVDTSPSWPTSSISTQIASDTASDNLDSVAQGDFYSQIAPALTQGPAALYGVVSQTQGVIGGVLGTANSFINAALAPLRDAAGIVNSVAGVGALLDSTVGLGRFVISPQNQFSIPINSVLGQVSNTLNVVSRVETGVTSLISNATAVRADVTSAFTQVGSLAQSL